MFQKPFVNQNRLEDLYEIQHKIGEVTGGELFARVADCERLSEEEASNFVQQILLGVQHMHGLGIVHLDLKVILRVILSLYCQLNVS
ncbi:unnamed protein product [Trichobilharzia regenti]|nr:unnamed protein product [Trichobilharzia regenti]